MQITKKGSMKWGNRNEWRKTYVYGPAQRKMDCGSGVVRVGFAIWGFANGCSVLPRHLCQGVFFRKAFYSLKRSFWLTLLSFYNFNLLAFLPPRPPPFPSSLLSRHSVLPRIGWLVLVTFSIMVMDNAPHTLLVTRYRSWVVTGWRQRRALRRG